EALEVRVPTRWVIVLLKGSSVSTSPLIDRLSVCLKIGAAALFDLLPMGRAVGPHARPHLFPVCRVISAIRRVQLGAVVRVLPAPFFSPCVARGPLFCVSWHAALVIFRNVRCPPADDARRRAGRRPACR